ncbi:MAG: DMT family transporter [Alphaproteobacteria bacterium]|jgi:drug/metabolite transporter (DMT)-like permease
MNNVLRGAAWMILAGFCWTIMTILVRQLSADYSSFEILFFRNLVSVCILLPLAMRSGLSSLKTQRLQLHSLRALLSYIGVLLLFYGIANIPLPDVTALSFTQPLFVVVLAALILKEVVNGARWIAVIAGFVGLLVIVRPGVVAVELATILVLLSAFSYAVSNICVKRLMTTDTANQSVFYFNLLMLPIALVPALFVWVTPALADLPLFVAIGVNGTIAVYAYARSFTLADASAVMPFDFLRMPMAATAAFLLFSETGDIWTWVGSVIIFASSYFLARSSSKSA